MGRLAIEQVVVSALIAHIKALEFEHTDGSNLQIHAVYDKFPTREEEIHPPAISVIAGPTHYEWELTARPLSGTYDSIKKSALIKRGEAAVSIQIDCFATLPQERSEIMRCLETAFLGADLNDGYLKLSADSSEYFGLPIIYFFDTAQGSFETEQSAEDGIRRTVLIGEAYIEYVEERAVALASIESPIALVEEIA